MKDKLREVGRGQSSFVLCPGVRITRATGLHTSSVWAAQQEVNGAQVKEASFVFTAAPHARLLSDQAALDSHRSMNSAVNCACEGAGRQAPYGNLMPDGLRWSWVVMPALGSGCKHR